MLLIYITGHIWSNFKKHLKPSLRLNICLPLIWRWAGEFSTTFWKSDSHFDESRKSLHSLWKFCFVIIYLWFWDHWLKQLQQQGMRSNKGCISKQAKNWTNLGSCSASRKHPVCISVIWLKTGTIFREHQSFATLRQEGMQEWAE